MDKETLGHLFTGALAFAGSVFLISCSIKEHEKLVAERDALGAKRFPSLADQRRYAKLCEQLGE